MKGKTIRARSSLSRIFNDLPRGEALDAVVEAVEHGDGKKFYGEFRKAVDDMDWQYLEIRRMSKRLFKGEEGREEVWD